VQVTIARPDSGQRPGRDLRATVRWTRGSRAGPDHDAGSVLYRRKAPGRFGDSQATFDAMDFLARLLMHIPQPKLHTVRYYGEYSSVARARRRAEKAEAQEEAGGSATVMPSAAERRRLRRAWAQMIRRIYEVEPLTCRCGAQMRIVAFILDPMWS
jgi:hypothetical protein